jgi:hypothetical protein
VVVGGVDREPFYPQTRFIHYLRSDIANYGEGLGRMKLQDKLIALHPMATFLPGNCAIAPCFMHGAWGINVSGDMSIIGGIPSMALKKRCPMRWLSLKDYPYNYYL